MSIIMKNNLFQNKEINLKRIRINDDRLCYVREYIILAKNMSQLAEFAERAKTAYDMLTLLLRK